MTDREKLIALLREGDCNALALEDCSYCKYDGEHDCSHQLLADILLANGVTFATDNHVGGKWIPVTERLPERTMPPHDVLVYHDLKCGMFVDRAWYSYDLNRWCSVLGMKLKVTHWMPLPEPPKEGE